MTGADGVRVSAPQLIVIFGATGDLARRMLFPGLYRLARAGMMPADFRVIGSGRRSPGTDEEFRERIAGGVREFAADHYDDDAWRDFAGRLSFTPSSADDGADLAEAVREAREELGEGTRTLLYLSVPPNAAQAMIGMLDATGLAADAALVMEKPFGEDLASARELDAAVARAVPEERVFRIDHFLGKEAVRNLLVLRFANGLLETVWNRDHIAYVQIDVPEEIDIQGRASFMESTGTFRDMVSTHLSQILGFVALEPPVRITAEDLRAEKLKVYRALRPIDPADVVFGQYEGYREEDGVAADSQVETFVALRAWVDNWRWQGVPFLLRTGKAMAATGHRVTIGFRRPPSALFGAGVFDGDARPDELVVELGDRPELSLDIRVKEAGAGLRLHRRGLRYAPSEDGAADAYEKLLLDAMRGDQTLFTGAAEIERLWEVCEPVLQDRPATRAYPKGSWGPEEALRLAGPRGWALADGDGD
ncbi:glucose-6-phosphate dehydrogenase [Actinomadura parmotrematis]|uniref:Glucose-6-phosphate 1-dehydrogenase n=1 Tax=Actinomadura parmotrematis TaxID=2864039 RepID=A0ABS7FY90_9ACTN|nr:glucose-6-phosphate dehydrogenase [Actinomadura parmotrematis]MBW8485414.1 glucose-6-phosphate dehydrogenase [Actinomadura parmotrematis]